MYGLILDTSKDPAIVILATDQIPLTVKLLYGRQSLSENFFPLIQESLQAGARSVGDLDYIGVGTGPGSYMGIRTAVTIAKAFAFAHDIPLVPFHSPLAFVPKDIVGPFTYIGDAKMGEVFVLEGATEATGNLQVIKGPYLVPLGKPLPDHAPLISELSLAGTTCLTPCLSATNIIRHCLSKFGQTTDLNCEIIYTR